MAQFTSTNQPPGHKKSRKGIPNFKTVLKKLIEISEESTSDGNKLNDHVIICKKLVEKAKDGDLTAIKEYFNRIEGMPKQEIDQTNKEVVQINRPEKREKEKELKLVKGDE